MSPDRKPSPSRGGKTHQGMGIRKAYQAARRDVHNTTRNLAGVSLADLEASDNNPAPPTSSDTIQAAPSSTVAVHDLNEIPVTIILHTGTRSKHRPIKRSKPIHTIIGRVNTEAHVMSTIEKKKRAMEDLKSIYNISLADFVACFFTFTNEHGKRWTVGISAVEKGTSPAFIEWKQLIESGALEHSPTCSCCNGEKYGVEIIVVLSPDGAVDKCDEVHDEKKELAEELADAKEEAEEYREESFRFESKVAKLEGEIEQLRELVTELDDQSEMKRLQIEEDDDEEMLN